MTFSHIAGCPAWRSMDFDVQAQDQGLNVCQTSFNLFIQSSHHSPGNSKILTCSTHDTKVFFPITCKERKQTFGRKKSSIVLCAKWLQDNRKLQHWFTFCTIEFWHYEIILKLVLIFSSKPTLEKSHWTAQPINFRIWEWNESKNFPLILRQNLHSIHGFPTLL